MVDWLAQRLITRRAALMKRTTCCWRNLICSWCLLEICCLHCGYVWSFCLFFTLHEFIMNILTFRCSHLFCVAAKSVYSVMFSQMRYMVICVSDVTRKFCLYFASVLYFFSWCNLHIFSEYKLLVVRLVCCFQGVFPDVSEVSTFHKYLEALLAFTQHPSQVVLLYILYNVCVDPQICSIY